MNVEAAIMNVESTHFQISFVPDLRLFQNKIMVLFQDIVQATTVPKVIMQLFFLIKLD